MAKKETKKSNKKELSKKDKVKKEQQLRAIKQFKDKYFYYYDDIKDYTRGKEDW